jgi:hypothetical protein
MHESSALKSGNTSLNLFGANCLLSTLCSKTPLHQWGMSAGSAKSRMFLGASFLCCVYFVVPLFIYSELVQP